MRLEFIHALLKLAAHDERIWLLTGDLGFNVLEPFVEQFPARFVNAGVAEQNMAGLAAGLALDGLTPFVYSIANFPILRCLEQIRNDVCYHDLPVRFISVGGGTAYGAAGYTHHAVEDLAIMRCLPGMAVFAPSDGFEATAAVAAIAPLAGPAYLRLGKGGEPALHQSVPDLRPGVPLVLRGGGSIALLATGAIAAEALYAAAILAESGVEAKVLSLPYLSPYDVSAVISAVGRGGHLFMIEELSGGSALSGMLETGYAQFFAAGIDIHRLSLDASVRHRIGDRNYLLKVGGLDGPAIAAAVATIIA